MNLQLLQKIKEKESKCFVEFLLGQFFSYYIYIIMGAVTYFFLHLEKKRKQKATPADV